MDKRDRMFENRCEGTIGLYQAMLRARWPICLLGCIGMLAGCMQVKPQAEFARTRQLIGDRTGAEAVYDPDADTLSADEIETMLADGLTIEEAVGLALLNNRRLQAEFMAIGSVKADLVQAGLLSNPTFPSARFRKAADGATPGDLA